MLAFAEIRRLVAQNESVETDGLLPVQKFFWNALNAKDVVKFNKFLILYMVPPFPD